MGCLDLHTIIKSHDILAFTETMKGTHFQQHFPGYQSFHFPRKLTNRNAKKDSWGILILISNKMHDSIQVRRESDTLVWITIQGKCLSLPYNVNIGIIYMPPEGSPYACPDDFENLDEMIRKKSKTGPVLICGDANSRTSEIPDFVCSQICEDMPELMPDRPNVTPRANVDKIVNSYGKILLDLYKYIGLQICNGRLCDSSNTCYKYNGESVVDYLLALPNTFCLIKHFQILDGMVHSDHCALSFSLSNDQLRKPLLKTAAPIKIRQMSSCINGTQL